MNRRNFLYSSLSSAIYLTLPKKVFSREKKGSVSFGIVADAHQDLMPDVEGRLASFIEMSGRKNADFILQLGDFCFPKKENRGFMDIWATFQKPKYHVLGNHDMDLSSKEETMDYWGMPAKYYSFDQSGFHFIVLDANYINRGGSYSDYDTANFYIDSSLRTWINPEQLEWLKDDLDKTDKPCIIFSHQSLVNDLWGVKNRSLVQEIFEAANRKAGKQKVLACFNGHNHIDYYRKLNGIYYIDINSLSYQWLGEKYQYKHRYGAEVDEKYPMMVNMAPYKDPLFAFIEINETGIKIGGHSSQYIGPSPESLGLTKQVYGYPFTANISSRDLSIQQ